MPEQLVNTEDIETKWNTLINKIGLALICSAVIPILLLFICLVLVDISKSQEYIVEIISSLLCVIPFIILAKNNNSAYLVKDAQTQNKKIYIFRSFCVVLMLQLICNLVIKFLDEYLFNGFISATAPDLLPTELTGFNLMLYYLYVGFIGPVIEEYIFRGVIFGSLKKYGAWFAIIISSILFGFMHMNLSQMFSAMFGGLVLGFVRAKSGSILPTIILHIVNNVIALLVNYGIIANILKQYVVLIIFYLVMCFIGLVTLIIGFMSSKRVFYFKDEEIIEIPNKYVDFFISPTIIVYILIVIKMISFGVDF